MNGFKRIITSKPFTIVSFALAAGLLIFSSVGGTQAALTYYSENYTSRVQMYDIGVSINENGNPVSYRDYVPNSNYVWDQHRGALLTHMLGENEELKLDVAYPEVITITNSGKADGESVDTYSRVILYKYWVDENGVKVTNLDPALIDLHLINIGTDWILDTEASTDERTVLYYSRLLKNGETTPALSDTLTINGILASKVTQTKGERVENGKTYKTLTTTYDYDGTSFVIEAVVNSIQNHNAEAAAKSVWGRDITIGEDGSLLLN
ncbi:MAG: hypothetical protein IJ796_09930 [Lachnospiraceae bacterium]|nr:hypothetical protein [Lachnospiraceae bacterium]